MENEEQSFDERMKRWYHYMEHKGMHERWIETCEGDLKVLVDIMGDYCDILDRRIRETKDQVELVASEVFRNYRVRVKRIQKQLEESIGYDRDMQIEICRKKKEKAPTRDDGVGEDAMVLAYRKNMAEARKEKKDV